MPFVESDFKSLNLRFGGPSKFIKHTINAKKTRDPFEIIGLTHSLFTSLHQMGFMKLEGTDKEIKTNKNKIFTEQDSSLASPLLAVTAKESATAMTLAKSGVDKITSIRTVENFLDKVSGIVRTRTGKKKSSSGKSEKKGSFVSAIGCINQGPDVASLDQKKIDDVFTLFAPDLHSSRRSYFNRRLFCTDGWAENLGFAYSRTYYLNVLSNFFGRVL